VSKSILGTGDIYAIINNMLQNDTEETPSADKKSKFNSCLRHKELLSGPFWQQIPAYAKVTEAEFLDHKWQLKNSITSVSTLLSTLRDLVSDEFYEDVKEGFQKAPMAVRVSPYVMSLIDWKNPYEDPLRLQFIPLASGLVPDHPELSLDTLHEQEDSPVPGFTHRYHDKGLLLALDICPVYCRYCTRSYAIGFDTDEVEKIRFRQDVKRYEDIFAYIKTQPQLEDIVISGGDAYMLKPDRLRFLCENLLKIPQIRRIRIATKGPAIMPMKILTDEDWYGAVKDMVDLGRKLHKEVCLHTHFSHPNEITDITLQAMNRFMEDGIRVRNQAVLQRGVNDSKETMELLTRRLSYINVQPYYVYMHDLVKGVEDLRTTLQVGLDLEKYIRGSTAGFNTPTFVVDAPGGGGKRAIHSYEYYDPNTGIAVYTAPSVKPGKYFLYFDPFDTLSKDIQLAWMNPKKRKEMKAEAIRMAKKHLGR
jgi:lysine 2,3-aminomutase